MTQGAASWFTIVTTTVAALSQLSTLVRADQTVCFRTEISTKRNIYKSDVIAYDLPTVSTGNDLSFSIETPVKYASIRPTFRESEKHEPLSKNFEDCYSYAPFNNTHYMYLCDQYKLAFVGYDEVTGDVIENRDGLIDSSLNCSSLLSSKHSLGRLFAICLNYTTNGPDGVPDLVIVPVDYVTLLPGAPISIEQDAANALGPNAQAILFDDSQTEGNFSYIYVFDPALGPFQFQLFIQNIGSSSIKHAGLFTSISNVSGLITPSHMVGMSTTNESIVLVMVNTSNPTNKNYFVQACSPRLDTNNQFVCDPNQHAYLGPTVDDGRYTMHKIAGKVGEYQVSFANTSLLVAYNVLLDFSAGSSEVAQVNISESEIDSVRGIFLGNDRIYLTGSVSNGSNMVLIYRVNSGEWERQIFSQTKSYGVNFIRRGIYDPDVDEHILIYEGKTFYSLVDRPELILLPFQTNLKSVSVTVNCFSGGTLINSRSVSVDILQEVNDGAFFSVPDVIDAYENSFQITVPLSSTDAYGNAPIYNVEFHNGPTKSNLTASVEYIYEVDTKYSGNVAKNVLDLYFMGDNLYIAETSNSLNVLKCESRPIVKTGECSLNTSLKFFNRQILDATAEGRFIFTLEASTYVSGDHVQQSLSNNVSYFMRDVADPSKGTEYVENKLKGQAGTLKVFGNELYALIVGTYENEPHVQYLMWSIFNLDTRKQKTGFTKLMKLPSNMCIKEVMFSPRTREKLYISSCCNGNKASSRVYEININIFVARQLPPTATLGRIFSEIPTTNFQICPTNYLLAIIDFDDNSVFAFELGGSENTKLQYEARNYGIDTIKHAHCDQENRIVQILGVNNQTDTEQADPEVKMVTYKLDSADLPQSRIHSVQTLSSTKVPEFIASTYNFENDQVSTLLMGSNTDNIVLLHLEITNSPTIYINASETKSNNYTLTYTASYPGGSGGSTATVTRQQQLRLITQQTDVVISLRNNSKIQLPKTGTVNLDALLDIKGPVQQFSLTKSSNLVLSDRMYPTEMFSNFTELFDRIATDGTVVLGYKEDGDKTSIKLVDTVTLKVLYQKDGDTLIDLGIIKGGYGFYALIKPAQGVNAQLLLIAKLSSGKWSPLIYSFYSSEIQFAVVHYAFNNSFVVASYNNEEFTLDIDLITMRGTDLDNMIFFNHKLNLRYTTDIVDFEFVKLEQYSPQKVYTPYFLVISAALQSTKGDFTMYTITNDTGLPKLQIAGLQHDVLIPDERVVHNQVDFSCETVETSDSQNQTQVRCFHNCLNLFSYFVQYTVQTVDAIRMQKFVKPSLIRKVKNIVNMSPMRSAISGNFGAVVVKNLAYDPTAPSNSIFGGMSLMLVYNFDYQDDPYKIFTGITLGMGAAKVDLQDLEPQFFKPAGTGTQKLAVNVGETNLSIKTFNLGPLTLVVNNGANANEQLSLGAVRIDGVNSSVGVSTLWEYNSTPEPDSPDKKKKALVFGTIILILGVISLVMYVVIIKIGKQSDQDFEDGYRAAATMNVKGYESESTIKTDETSIKI